MPISSNFWNICSLVLKEVFIFSVPNRFPKLPQMKLVRTQSVGSVAHSCPTLCEPMNCSTPGLPVHHQLRSLPKLMSIESVMPSNHLILCRPLLPSPSIFPSIRVFSNESALCMRWLKYWSFSFNISPSNEHSGMISFRMDCGSPCSPRDSQESSLTT